MIEPFKDTLVVNELSISERNLLDRVMSNYNYEVIDYVKTRSAYKVVTSTCNLCLKRMKHGRHKASNGYILVNELFKQGFLNTPGYIKTKNDQYYVECNRFIFYVTEWINGSECDLSQLDEAVECSKTLANFHNATEKININTLKVRNNLRNWPRVFSNSLTDMEKFKKIIEKKKLRNEFDLMYISCIDSFYERGTAALSLLDRSDYFKLSKLVSEKKTLCHDSFYYQNILKKENKYYIIDLDSILIDLQINDLGKYIRRLMYKKEYQWSFQKAQKIIEAYSSVRKVNKNELETMLALIIFPHKFWKLGKKRYIKRKNWSEQKYTHKLEKLLKHNELQQRFLEDYLSYLNNL